MSKIIYNYLILIIFLVISNLSNGQVQNKLGDFNEYEKKAKKNKLSNAKFLYENNVDLSNIKKLKSLGVDLYEMQIKSGTNYKEAVLFSDVIASGTVIKREYDNSSDANFHTTLYIEINETFKGSSALEKTTPIIQIKLVSGRVGKNFVSVSHEPEFFLGEEVLLYLNDSDGNRMKTFINNGMSVDSNFEQKVYKNVSKGKSGYSKFYTVNKKYKIKQNLVFDSNNSRIDNVQNVKETIISINNIN